DSYNSSKLAQSGYLNIVQTKTQISEEENTRISDKYNKLYKEYEILRKSNSEMLLQNEKILLQIKELMGQNEQLKVINRELTKDNIALQNSLKMAASVGIKPQNFRRFNGITRGEVERGEYAGCFLGTAYTPSTEECGNNEGITNSGIPIIPGVSIAVDTKYWPIGTLFYIRGLGYAVAMDTGAAIKGKYRFDFAVFDKKFADELGVRYWDMYVIKYGNGKISKIHF
ncbi:MAG TPA: 3D domain-containing protein, partial [Clostridia bacterium]|nr:3D domain-containing protein [Clostridia bacterium]